MQGLPTKLFFLGLSCLFGTIAIFWVIVPGAIDWAVTKIIRIEEGNLVYQEFANIDAEILFKVYLYNVTNGEDVANGTSTPIVEEIGPYVYEEKRVNTPLKMDSDNDLFSYHTEMLFHFRPDLSNGSDEDVITMLNVPIVAIGHELNNWSRVIRYMAKVYLKTFDEPLIVNHKVKTVLFEGIHMELVETVSGILGQEYLPNNTFGYFYEKNATVSAPYVIKAGIQDNSLFGKIVSWKDQEKLDIWPGESCNMINGSDTSLYPPFITKDSILRGFEADICRSVYLEYKREEEVEGIKAFRFGMPDDFFDPTTEYNQCFCPEEDKSLCPENGVLSIGPCRFGAPLYISNPHFLHGDPIHNERTGLSPGKAELHESFALIEPKTGVVLKGSKRAQINIMMKKSKDIPQLNNVKEALVPLVWVDESAAQSPEKFKEIKMKMVYPLLLVEVGKWIMLSLSSVLVLVGVIVFVFRTKDKKPVDYY